VGRPQVRQSSFIKIPGTAPALQPSIRLLPSGNHGNVDLLFSPSCFRAVANAYIEVWNQRVGCKEAVDRVASGSSFFLRIDANAIRSLTVAASVKAAARVAGGQAAIAKRGSCVQKIYE